MPTAEQMSRFWLLVQRGAVSDRSFEEVLASAEAQALADGLLGPELSSTAEELEAQRRFRAELDATGPAYFVLLAPARGGNTAGAKLQRLLGELRTHASSPIASIRDLVQCTETVFANYLGAGPSAKAYLRGRLAQAGLRFGMAPREIEVSFNLERGQVDDSRLQAARRFSLDQARWRYADLFPLPDTEEGERTRSFLQQLSKPGAARQPHPYGGTQRIESLRHLVFLPAKALMAAKGADRTVLECLDAALAALGLRSGMLLPEIEEAFTFAATR